MTSNYIIEHTVNIERNGWYVFLFTSLLYMKKNLNSKIISKYSFNKQLKYKLKVTIAHKKLLETF